MRLQPLYINLERVKNKDKFVSCKPTVTAMKVINLGLKNSVLNKFVAQMRDRDVQKDSMRFRRNLASHSDLCFLAYN